MADKLSAPITVNSPSSPVPYLVLARKYRPSKFIDLKGQDHLVQTITNAIKSNRIAHAFLLTGIRGVGKTTSSRIMARALNCIGADGSLTTPAIEPCGVCINCTNIASGYHPDVFELDAASHTGVDDIRNIIEQVQYRPIQARYKVIIIDEVHMLSSNAFNALLKTLEEPPAHVKFIFATTELSKIPLTIISRCQRFDLRRFSIDELSDNIISIAAQEDINITILAAKLIARYADGSARDSLSLLDQAIALAGANNSHDPAAADKITIEASTIASMLGIADQTAIIILLNALLGGDIKQALSLINQLYYSGNDPINIIEELLNIAHLLSRYKATGEEHDLGEEFTKLVNSLTIASLSRLWQMLLKGLEEVRISAYPLQAIEMLFIRISYSGNMPTLDQVLQVIKSPKTSANISNEISNSVSVNETIGSNNNSNSDKIAINDFQDLRNLCIAKREMILYYQLYNDVHIYEFTSGHIALNFKASAAPDLETKLKKFLQENTALKWVIEKRDSSKEDLTYADQEQVEFERKKNLVKSDPLIRAVLDNYQEAEIISIKDRSIE